MIFSRKLVFIKLFATQSLIAIHRLQSISKIKSRTLIDQFPQKQSEIKSHDPLDFPKTPLEFCKSI
jgi:hypothetical protein